MTCYRLMMSTVIYVLIDPRNDAIRYVGATAQCPKERLRRHLRYSVGAKAIWIAELLALGLVPLMQIIEVAGADWRRRERFWIAEMRSLGADIINAMPGGGGPPIGFHQTEAAKEKISKASKGRKSVGWKHGMRHTPESLAKMSRVQSGKKISAEQREKISNALRGQHPSEETREKLRRKVFSLEQRAKLSAAATRQWEAFKLAGLEGRLRT